MTRYESFKINRADVGLLKALMRVWRGTRLYGAYCVLRGRTVVTHVLFKGRTLYVTDYGWIAHNTFTAPDSLNQGIIFAVRDEIGAKK
jgi:hypothetical protein